MNGTANWRRAWSASVRRSTPRRNKLDERCMRAQQLRRKLMRHSIGVVIAATLFLGVAAPAATQDLGGTLKKVRESGVITIGHRDSSIPLSYLNDKTQTVGVSIQLFMT